MPNCNLLGGIYDAQQRVPLRMYLLPKTVQDNFCGRIFCCDAGIASKIQLGGILDCYIVNLPLHYYFKTHTR